MALLPQSCIVTHESNGIDIITALILNDISPLCKYRMDLVLQLKVGRGPGWGGGHARLHRCVGSLTWLWGVLWGEVAAGRVSGPGVWEHVGLVGQDKGQRAQTEA